MNLIWIYLLCILCVISMLIIFYFFRYIRIQRNIFIQARNPTFISNQFFRECWEWFTYPVFQLLIFLKIKPNQISFLSLYLAILSSIALLYSNIIFAGILLLISALFDTLDGRLARYLKIDSNSGAFLDSILDRYSDYFIYISILILWLQYNSLYFLLPIFFVILGSNLISYSKERGNNLGCLDTKGLMQRADRIIILTFGFLFNPLGNFIYSYLNNQKNPEFPYYTLFFTLCIIAIFSNISAILRIRRIYNKLLMRH